MIMKYLVLFHFLFFLFISKTHAQDYKDRFRADICNCLEEEENFTAKNIDYVYGACFKKHLVFYADIIDSEIIEENKIVKYRKGQKARTDLQVAFKGELIYTCDIYYHTIENARSIALQEARLNPLNTSDLETLSQQVAMQPSMDSYLRRAQFYFQHDNLTEAEKDVQKCIEITPNGYNYYQIKSKLLLAWIKEEQAKYQDAIAIYDEVKGSDLDYKIEILKGIAVRKSKGEGLIGVPKENMTMKNKETTTIERSRKGTSVKPKEEEKKSAKSLRSLFKQEK